MIVFTYSFYDLFYVYRFPRLYVPEFSISPLFSDLTVFDMLHLICYLLLCRSPLIFAEERRHINAEIHYNHTEEWLYG